jgi:hypothetical protein
MVSVLGDIQPQDDYTHPLGSEVNLNESMYFNCFDRGRALGRFVRIGNRANEGYAKECRCRGRIFWAMTVWACRSF